MRKTLALVSTLGACSVDKSNPVDPQEVPTAQALECGDGQFVAWRDGAWACEPAPAADYRAFGACPPGQKVTGVDAESGAVVCAADVDTDTDTDTLGALACGDGEIARWDGDGEAWICDEDQDPVFGVSAAAGIAAGDVTSWNAAYGWGDHAAAGYLASESDPVFGVSAAAGIAAGDVTSWNAAYGWGNHTAAGYLASFTEADPVFGVSAAAGIAAGDVTSWNAAYGWGNHTAAGYLTSFTETDPVFGASAAAGITSANVTNWNAAYGWGSHAAAGYLTSASALNADLLASGTVPLGRLPIGTGASQVAAGDHAHGYVDGAALQTALDAAALCPRLTLIDHAVRRYALDTSETAITVCTYGADEMVKVGDLSVDRPLQRGGRG